jgi:ubiquinone/menaquinone biosynthesis C-methylase UbiE
MWIVILGLMLGLIVWELWVCEGAHLGRRFVVWLYDLAAPRYEKIKNFDPDWERHFLGEPLAAATTYLGRVQVLDIGAGTGRLARTLLPLPNFLGVITCVEPSIRMLALGHRQLSSERVHWTRAWAVPLPFSERSFDVVVSLEVLEFTPSPIQTLKEMFRVLRPGGWLLITNRIGREASWILGKTFKRDAFTLTLEGMGLQDIITYPWQADYDLIWARKTGNIKQRPSIQQMSNNSL